MSSLKDALLKAGFKPAKTQNERPKATLNKAPPANNSASRPSAPPRSHVNPNPPAPKKIHAHQASRNYCEVCDRTQPDVEQYKHRNPTVHGQWICISCADKNEIPDSTRVTAQSDMSKKKMFRRFFGSTNMSLRPENSGPSGSGGNSGNPSDGNR